MFLQYKNSKSNTLINALQVKHREVSNSKVLSALPPSTQLSRWTVLSGQGEAGYHRQAFKGDNSAGTEIH